jgi:hypothetical protein
VKGEPAAADGRRPQVRTVWQQDASQVATSWKIEVSESENKTPGQHPEVDMRDVLRDRFSAGQGFIQLQLGMTDEMMLFIIKQAISLGNGKVFTVIPPSQQRFRGLQGFIQLYSGMTDEEMLFVIKQAISLGNGKAFTVTPPSKINDNV